MTPRLDHIGIAVSDLDAAVTAWSAGLGLALGRLEDVPGQGIRARHLEADGTRIELLAPLGPASPVARFLERSGPGLHHLAFAVDDLDRERARMVAAGLEPIGEPSIGSGGRRIQFFHPRSTGGVLIEICAAPQADARGAGGC